jgi:hypothetical protein
MEVTYEEGWAEGPTPRAHLGLYSLITLYVQANLRQLDLTPRRAAWYPKTHPTFANALVAVRLSLWSDLNLVTGSKSDETIQIPQVLFLRLVQAAAYAP